MKTGLNLRTPAPAEFSRPVILKRGDILALEEPRDVARPAHHPPVDRDRAAGLGAIPLREAARIFEANRLVVRRDDDDRVIRLRHGRARRPQRKRQRHDRDQRKNDDRPFQRRKDTVNSKARKP